MKTTVLKNRSCLIASLSLILAAIVLTIHSHPVLAQTSNNPLLTIDNLNLVSSKRISRTVFEYIYTAEITNTGIDLIKTTATVSSTSPSTTIVDRDIAFGNVVSGDTVSSVDTITIRQDRRSPFIQEKLVWAFFSGGKVIANPNGKFDIFLHPDNSIIINETLSDAVRQYFAEKDIEGLPKSISRIDYQGIEGTRAMDFDSQGRLIEFNSESGTIFYKWLSDAIVQITYTTLDGKRGGHVLTEAYNVLTGETINVSALTESSAGINALQLLSDESFSQAELVNDLNITPLANEFDSFDVTMDLILTNCASELVDADPGSVRFRHRGEHVTINPVTGEEIVFNIGESFDATRVGVGEYHARHRVDMAEAAFVDEKTWCDAAEVSLKKVLNTLNQKAFEVGCFIVTPFQTVFFPELDCGQDLLLKPLDERVEICQAARTIGRVFAGLPSDPNRGFNITAEFKTDGVRSTTEEKLLQAVPDNNVTFEGISPILLIPPGTYTGNASSSFAGHTLTAELTVEIDHNGSISHLFWPGGEVLTQNPPTRTIFGLYEMKRISENMISIEHFGNLPQTVEARYTFPSCFRQTIARGNFFQIEINAELIITDPPTIEIRIPYLDGSTLVTK